MAKQILVPMKRNDRVEDFIAYIEKVARPGMKVVFMVRYPVDGLRWSNEEFGIKAIRDGISLANSYTWANCQKEAKERVSRASTALPARKIEVETNLYAGSIRSAVHERMTKGGVHLIVTRAGILEKIARLFNGTNSLLDLFKQPVESAVLMIHPGVGA